MRSKRFVDLHAVLGLAPGATAADVQRAYRRRARVLHPDIAGPGATARMAELNRARDELMASLPPASEDASERTFDAARRRPASPTWAMEHEAAWEDYWAAWNELPKRGEQPE